ncbi:MAG: hypothetical protein JXA67_22030 [Micromonosporaceae bacterium]|nr:hypothetical protein [Micromonosporaceae bacterium]
MSYGSSAPGGWGEHQAVIARMRADPYSLGAPQVLMIDNRDDSAATVGYLAQLGGPAQGRAVLRPTPGATDRAVLGLDLLVALGKNPEMLRQERQLAGECWSLAQAWLAALDVRDLVLDRAHAVPVEAVLNLVALARRCRRTRLWLVWSGEQDTTGLQTRLADAGRPVFLVHLADLPRILPVAPPDRPGPPAWPRTRPPAPPPRGLTAAQRRHRDGRPRPPVPAEPTWPDLPAADFTTFRAACARLLAPAQFDRVDALYQTTAARVDEWLAERRQRRTSAAAATDAASAQAGWPDLLQEVQPLRLDDIGHGLVHLLREQMPGTRPAVEALIRLRAIQAALFLAGILLRWDTQALGPDPAARLRGDLTPQVSASLMTMARTDHAALTALALHLNQGPAYFTCWQLTDLAEDGSVLYEPARHQHNPPKWMSYPDYQAQMARRVGITEIPCAGSVVIPEHARPILAAHYAYRMDRTDEDGWQLFPIPPDASRTRPATGTLREAIIRTCEWLNLDPPWMHRDPCRHGADAGLSPRVHGWLAERGLSLHPLDPMLVAHLHWRYRRYHPAHGGTGGQ